MSNESFSRAIEFVDRQCRRLSEQHPGYYPMYTVKGQWPADAEAWTHWCDGFYPGIFWLLHQHT
ncbi:MAG: glucuronyl hydrolase, partial [Gemmataceae bacterium]